MHFRRTVALNRELVFFGKIDTCTPSIHQVDCELRQHCICLFLRNAPIHQIEGYPSTVLNPSLFKPFVLEALSHFGRIAEVGFLCLQHAD